MKNRKELMRQIVVPAVVGFITALFVGVGFVFWIKTNSQFLTGIFNPAQQKSESEINTDAPSLYSFETVVVETVKKANPAVVAITISKNVPVYERYYRSVPNLFEDFFGGGFFNFDVPEIRQNGTEKREVGGGSGFLVSADGYIVTNRHVVDDDKAEYTVFMNDGEKYDAKVIARDSVLDLAIIKIDGSGFQYLEFGDSDKLQVGQSVITIGNALAEFRNTVSLGIVSGLSRSIVASDMRGNTEALDQLIQTDAAINQGNSGGPLLNLSGEVVGVNVAIASGAENIGFAVSSNSVKSVVDSVKKTGKIVRPYIGVRYTSITEEIKEKNNLPVDYGVLVLRGSEPGDLAVIPGSPADKAGIVENDIILEVDGVKLTEDKNFATIIRNKKVGDVIRLKISHKGQEKTVTVTLEEMK
ncbi:MAG: trypsin-like serine protease [Parcubacteria group bacterium]|nr:trypsin-like serine protease [Parcubacteria group bacterium]